MISEIVKDSVDEVVIIDGVEVKTWSIGLVDRPILEDDEIDIERKACELRHELVAFQRGQRDKAWAEQIIKICSLAGWRIIFEPNCFTGFPEPDFIKGFNNEYLVKEAGCEFYHGPLVDLD